MSIKDLREKRSQLVGQLRSMMDAAETRAMSDEETQRFDALAAEVEQIKEKIARLESLESEEAEVQEEAERSRRSTGRRVPPTQGTTSTADALRSWLLGTGERTFTFSMQPNALRSFSDVQTWTNRNQSTLTGPAGGHLVAPEFQRELETALLTFGGARQHARIVRTSTGANLDWPTLNDTANEGRILTQLGVAGQEEMAFGKVSFGAHKYTSDIVLVSSELLQDSAFNVAAEVGTALGERIGRIANRHFTVGTGTNQPAGIVTGASLGITGSSATSVTYDDLVNLEHSVNRAYRNGAKFVFADSTLRELKRLKDAEGRPLWVPGLTANAPDTILGYEYVVNDDVAAMAAGARSILFGDMSKFIIRDVRDVQLRRLDERYAEFDAVAFVAFSRHDSKVIDAGTGPIRYMQNAAA